MTHTYTHTHTQVHIRIVSLFLKKNQNLIKEGIVSFFHPSTGHIVALETRGNTAYFCHYNLPSLVPMKCQRHLYRYSDFNAT